jgi:hypothetical protein
LPTAMVLTRRAIPSVCFQQGRSDPIGFDLIIVWVYLVSVPLSNLQRGVQVESLPVQRCSFRKAYLIAVSTLMRKRSGPHQLI